MEDAQTSNPVYYLLSSSDFVETQGHRDTIKRAEHGGIIMPRLQCGCHKLEEEEAEVRMVFVYDR